MRKCERRLISPNELSIPIGAGAATTALVYESSAPATAALILGPAAGAKRALFIGGKSMGGRIATQVAAGDPGLPIAGLVLLGYPLHPPGRPAERRDKHLPAVGRPMLFVQGSRDAFGTPEELTPLVATLQPAPV